MLESATVVGGIIVEIVGVGEEVATRREDIACGEIDSWESEICRSVDFKYGFRLAIQVFSKLVTQVGVDISVTNHFDRVVNSDSAMVGGQYDLISHVSNGTEEIDSGTMLKPCAGDGTIGSLVVCEFSHCLRLCAGMREHIDEVEHNDIELVLLQRVELCYITLSEIGLIDFVV